MVSDVPVDDEAPVVTSRIFRSTGAQSFGGAHRGRVCVFIGCECACVLWASSLYCVILKKSNSATPVGRANVLPYEDLVGGHKKSISSRGSE